MIFSRLLSKKKQQKKQEETDGGGAGGSAKGKGKMPELNEYLVSRDYSGAISVLTFQKRDSKDSTLNLWLAYCAFHAGDYKYAAEQYELLIKEHREPTPNVRTYLACCQFYMGDHDDAWTTAESAPDSALKVRLLFHVSHKRRDEKAVMEYHRQLKPVLEDQLCLASIHYLRNHYQEAIDIYKQELLKNRNFIALNVYLALCYYKLDYYDVSLEVLNLYLTQFSDSATAVNLRACNHYKLYNGRNAENELRVFEQQATPTLQFARDLINHNMVVFRGGEKALQVLPALVDVLSEARLNLIIYYLRQTPSGKHSRAHRNLFTFNNSDLDAALTLVDELEPQNPPEFIIKAIVYTLVGQHNQLKDHVKIAQEFFQSVGSSLTECDTLPGRQCMASSCFLLKNFTDVLVYLNSIKSYFYSDDTFNFNYGQALAYTGAYQEAEEALLVVHDVVLTSNYAYMATLARCHIMNNNARLAWELYLRLENERDSFSLLQVIANDCYKVGAFFYAAKAFDVLEKLDANPEYWEGKRGACVGTLQLVIAGREPADTLREIIAMLETSNHPQVDYITRVMRKWAKENKIDYV